MSAGETFDAGPLGRSAGNPVGHDPKLLCGIPRAATRSTLGLRGELPFRGEDLWTAWEIYWLGASGRPAARVLELSLPADSPCLVESKSFKLYLNALNGERVGSAADFMALLLEDLTPVLGMAPRIALLGEEEVRARGLDPMPGTCIDGAPVAAMDGAPSSERLIGACQAGDVVEETLHSHLLRTLCPVTGQPDWASVVITYRGRPIDHGRLLEYLLGYREHQGFHELCVERIFLDLREHCATERLSVRACYTRRGGIDIQPFRSDHEAAGRALRPWRG